MDSVKLKVATAMKHLGVKGTVTVAHISFSDYRIALNGSYFGIFDADRCTFVD